MSKFKKYFDDLAYNKLVGSKANTVLRNTFAEAKEGHIRVLKVVIDKEQLTCANVKQYASDWRTDFDSLVNRLLDNDTPCYLFYRLDEENDQGYRWIYICYTPDHAPVRQKMLYASTRSTCKMEFGAGNVRDELHGTAPEDITLDAYDKHLISLDAPAPLTMAEEELEEIKRKEVRADIAVDTKHQTMGGVAFPITDEARLCLLQLHDDELNYVQLALNLEKEEIFLAMANNIEVNKLSNVIPTDHGRYNFFKYKHNFEGTFFNTIVFIYTMPGYKCPIKERMLYSSCKSSLVEHVEQNLKIELNRKLETDDPKELTEQFISDEIHPKQDIVRQKFARPKGPQSRGPRRLTKQTD